MSNWSGNWITRRGRELLAKVGKGGNRLEFTKMKLGDGIETLDAVDELTDLVGPKLTYGISSIAQSGSTCTIIGVVSSETVSEAFQVRENGLFAKDPDLGEILFAINLDNIPDTLISAGGTSAITIQYAQNLVFTNATDVTAVIDPSGLVTTKVMTNAITTHNSAPDAHENRFSQYLPLTGGVMTGAIVVGNCPGMRKATDREETYIYGGTTNQDGAAFGLCGVNCTAYGEEARGSFSIVAKSPSGERHTLTGLKDGRLLWDGKHIVYPEEIITWKSPTGEEWYYAIRWPDGRAEIHGHAIQKANNLGITLNYPIPLVSGITGEATVVAKAGSAFTGLVSFTFGTATVGYFTVRYHDYSVPTEPISICFTVRGYWK